VIYITNLPKLNAFLKNPNYPAGGQGYWVLGANGMNNCGLGPEGSARTARSMQPTCLYWIFR